MKKGRLPIWLLFLFMLIGGFVGAGIGAGIGGGLGAVIGGIIGAILGFLLCLSGWFQPTTA